MDQSSRQGGVCHKHRAKKYYAAAIDAQIKLKKEEECVLCSNNGAKIKVSSYATLKDAKTKPDKEECV